MGKCCEAASLVCGLFLHTLSKVLCVKFATLQFEVVVHFFKSAENIK